MRAHANCPKCGEFLETSCRGCIEGKSCVHSCDDSENKDFEIVEGVEWKLVPENERELMEVEGED
jgi:hypothetical protein